MDVTDWLRALGLERYETAFRENDVSAEILRDLTDYDLKELGITSLGHRRQLLKAIAALQGERLAGGIPAVKKGRSAVEDAPLDRPASADNSP